MFHVPRQVKIFVALDPVDMRRGSMACRPWFKKRSKQDPLSGPLVPVSQSPPATGVKLLFWDGDGYALFYKRLARGTFEFPVPQDPQSPTIELRG